MRKEEMLQTLFMAEIWYVILVVLKVDLGIWG